VAAAAPDPVLSAPAPAPAESAPSPAAPADATFAASLGALEEAKRTLATDPTRALALLAEHERRYGATLSDERELLRIQGLRRAGRESEMRARAAAWLAREPRGLYAERLRALLSPPPQPPSSGGGR
jgi:hypothetical protein